MLVWKNDFQTNMVVMMIMMMMMMIRWVILLSNKILSEIFLKGLFDEKWLIIGIFFLMISGYNLS